MVVGLKCHWVGIGAVDLLLPAKTTVEAEVRCASGFKGDTIPSQFPSTHITNRNNSRPRPILLNTSPALINRKIPRLRIHPPPTPLIPPLQLPHLLRLPIIPRRPTTIVPIFRIILPAVQIRREIGTLLRHLGGLPGYVVQQAE